MKTILQLLVKTDERLDALGDKLKDKYISFPTELLGAGIFMVFAVIMLIIMPRQVAVSESDVVNGRAFPTLLMVIIIICSGLMLGNALLKALRHEPIPKFTLHLLTELKALVILAILFLSFLISKLTNVFAIGACFCALGFLLYFRCKKRLYYVITLGLAIIIWAAFRFGLGVKF